MLSRLLMLSALWGILHLSMTATQAAPVPKNPGSGGTIAREGFIPSRKHMPLPGKIIAVLVKDAQPILSTEGRSGPADQLCIGYNAGSYRWVYVPVKDNPMITNLQVPVGEGKIKVYPALSMASLRTVEPWKITTPYTLVEVEVNDGEGSPAGDSFVATKMTPLDGTKDFPIKVTEAVEAARRDYDKFLGEKSREWDAAMDEAAKKILKEKKPTGPREKQTLMFVTWMPDSQTLNIRFLTKIIDGDYKYGNGVNIDLPPPPLPAGPAQGGIAPPPRLPNGLRFGTQFGIEMGASYEISKTGKVEKIRMLEVQSFSNELPPPPAFDGRRPRPLPLPVPPNVKPGIRPVPLPAPIKD